MMTRLTNSKSSLRLSVFLASVLFLGALSGCATSGTSSEATPNEEAVAAPESAPRDALDGAVGEQPSTQPKMNAEPAPKNAAGDSRYKTLAQAVRSGQSNAVNDEAVKILAANQYDPVALNTLALQHFKRGKIGAAKLLLSRAIDKSPPTASLLNNLAVVYLEEGDKNGALAQLKKAYRLDDRHFETLANLGAIYVQGGDYAKARPLLEQAYRQKTSDVAVANNYAITLRAQKDYDNAKRIYDDLLKGHSRDVNVLLNYAILLIDYMNRPKDGLDLVNKVKFIETERKDVLSRANALEKKARSEVK